VICLQPELALQSMETALELQVSTHCFSQQTLAILAKSNRNCMHSMMHADTEDDDAA